MLAIAKDGERVVPSACLPRRDESPSNQFRAFGSGDLLGGFHDFAYLAWQRIRTEKPGLACVVRPDRPNVEHHAQNERHGDGRPYTDIPPRAMHR